jgi:hypothetical protein
MNNSQHATEDNNLFADTMNILLQRLIQLIGLEKIKSAAINNEPMPSLMSTNSVKKTRGFRDGKFSTADLEALLSLEDNFDKLQREEKLIYASASFIFFHIIK